MAKRKASGKARSKAKRKTREAEAEAPRCAHGETTDAATGKAPGYDGPGHCAGCDAQSAALGEQFDTSFEAGEYNRQGFTRNEWKAAGHDPDAWADAPELDAEAAGATRGVGRKKAKRAEAPPHWQVAETGDEPAVAEPVTHLAKCLECAASVRYTLTPSGHGLTVLERSTLNPHRIPFNTPAPAATGSRTPPAASQGRRVAPAPATSRPASLVSPDGAMPPGELAVLTAALTYADGLDKKRLGVLTGYKRSSRDAYIARLTTKGLVETRGALLYPTAAGRAALNGSFEPLPTGSALVEYWRARLPEGERKTLDVLLVEGGDVARELIDERTSYKRSSRDAYLTRLKARGLVEFSGRGTVRASSELFD